MIRATLDLPISPSVNALWRHGKGNTYRTPEYDQWRHDAGWALKEQKPPSFRGWVALKVTVGIPERRRDLDNVAKALFDLLVEHRTIDDDASIAAFHFRWDRTVPTGRVHVAQDKVRLRIVELQAQVAAQSVIAAALTIDAHLEKLRELRDDARQRGQLSAAIRAEELRGQLRRFYVKQIETGDAGDFSRMSDEELRAYVYGTSDEPSPKGKGPVKH